MTTEIEALIAKKRESTQSLSSGCVLHDAGEDRVSSINGDAPEEKKIHCFRDKAAKMMKVKCNRVTYNAAGLVMHCGGKEEEEGINFHCRAGLQQSIRTDVCRSKTLNCLCNYVT